MRVLLVAGARPNFMKIAPIFHAAPDWAECRIVHTEQHYDYRMSQVFFDELDLPAPNYFLDAGSGSHAVQTAKVMVAFEKICLEANPDLVIVVGDVNSTMACSITARKLSIKVAHVEAGLRSFDLRMPEEINRMVTDTVSDYCFVTEADGVRNLEREGKPAEQIFFVGQVMIDNLLYQTRKLNEMDCRALKVWDLHKSLGAKGYLFLTLHRPSNVDDREVFAGIIEVMNELAENSPIIFPVHPRTETRLAEFGLKLSKKIIRLGPLSFRESLFLWRDAALVLTDSGGLQEETTALGVPCITLRENTERPITVEIGTNTLAGNQRASIRSAWAQVGNGRTSGRIPVLWDGKSAVRIWNFLNAEREDGYFITKKSA